MSIQYGQCHIFCDCSACQRYNDHKGSSSFRPQDVVPVVLIYNGGVHANVPKIHQTKIAFPKLRVKYSSPYSSLWGTVSDCSREETITPSS